MLNQDQIKEGKILSLDYGKKYIGLAISDANRSMAFGRGTLQKTDINVIAKSIKKICLNENVQEILIGLPLAEDGNETVQTENIRLFAEELELILNKEINKLKFIFIDEAFTTFQAREFLKEMGVKKSDQKATLDELAAIFILKRYIDFY